MREGDIGDHFYILVEGQIEIVKALETPDERIVAIRQVGDFIGEMSLLNKDGLRTASVRAVSNSLLLEMVRADFDHLLECYPQLAYEMVRVLSFRLRATQNKTINDLREKNRQLRQAYDELKVAQEQLVEKERLERELQVAHDIQMSIVPAELPQAAGYDFGALMEPARMVGGDFFDFFPLRKGKFGVLIGDVTDKGVPAALFMAQTHAYLQAEAGCDISPRDTLLRVNQHLLRKDGNSYLVTVLYGILDQDTGVFEYARAGHELPLLYTPNVGITQTPLDVGLALGIQDNPPLDEKNLLIPSGGSLLIYTDGFTDGLSADDHELALSRLMETFNQIDGQEAGAQEICDQLFQLVSSSQGEEGQFDDVTLVVLKRMD